MKQSIIFHSKKSQISLYHRGRWIFPLLLFLMLTKLTVADQPVKASDLIPRPLHCADKVGHFVIQPGMKIAAPEAFNDIARLLNEKLTDNKSAVETNDRDAAIVYTKTDKLSGLGDEGYELVISPGKISINASTIQGARAASFTLLQLQLLQPDMTLIPCAEIRDTPRFSYKGMHLDVSRNFFPVSFIKKYIDLMALYKYNTFHWHLTDGPGWRLEIKKYPLLTKVAAFRTHRTWKEWWNSKRRFSREGDPDAYGGYYTQDEAREVVAYAARRGITVIPEIEIPGHSNEVLAVYPELSCTGKPYESGEYCIGNPDTYNFLVNVLTEVMEIFPSKYIHIGGDEASHAHWEKCPKCQALEKEQGLKNEYELQAYLIKRVSRFLQSHGRKIIGWDEIVDGGLPQGARVMNWRGAQSGIKAAQQGHQVIMTPAQTYFDKYQSDPLTQPEAIGGYLPLSAVYNFEPIPDGLSPELEKYYIGTQGNLWSEYLPTTYQVEYMAYPRAIALAEVAWSPRQGKNFDDFQRRLQSHYRLLQRLNVNYYRPSAYLTIDARPDTVRKQDRIIIESERYKPTIRYTLDGSVPDSTSQLYTGPFYTSGKTEIRAVLFKNGEPGGEICNYTANYHKAIGRKVIYNNPWSNSYPARGKKTLTNGVFGSLTYQDKEWMGFLKDFDVAVDMGKVQPISSVSLRFMYQPGPGVFLPSSVEIEFSNDGIKFTPIEKLTSKKEPENVKLDFVTYHFNCKEKEARYIRILAPNDMNGFMFVDEVVVY